MISIRERIAKKPSVALKAMCDGLERQSKEPDFEIDMGTFFRRTQGVCVGCAATCAILELAYEPGTTRDKEDFLVHRYHRSLPGEVIPIAACSGFRFLRLSTLAVSPEHRERAFTTHFQAQVAAGLFAPGGATIAQLRRLAEEQL